MAETQVRGYAWYSFCSSSTSKSWLPLGRLFAVEYHFSLLAWTLNYTDCAMIYKKTTLKTPFSRKKFFSSAYTNTYQAAPAPVSPDFAMLFAFFLPNQYTFFSSYPRHCAQQAGRPAPCLWDPLINQTTYLPPPNPYHFFSFFLQ